MRVAILLLAWLAAAQTPDRTPLPDEWGYRPAHGAIVPLDPPSLSWVHEKDAASYELQWARNPDFQGATSVTGI
ncbi:MAG: hypothetical protein ACPL88_13145, partial [Bryobacteraceae bacterium]